MKKRTIQLTVTYWFLILPALIWFLVFFLVPLIEVIQNSFHEWQTILRPKKFIGFSNYTFLFQDEVFWKVLGNSLIRIAVNFIIMMPIALILGHFLTLKVRGSQLFRTIFFFPFLLSSIATALMWWLIFLPQGVLNSLLRDLGLGNLARAWIASSSDALWVTIVPMVWTAIGFYAVLYFAVLQDIPKSLYEAAEIDGLSIFGKFLKISLPLSIPFMGVYFIWELIGAFNNFGSVHILTRGGPGNASNILGYYAYLQAFRMRNLGYASTLSVITFILCLVLALIIQKLVDRDYEF